ncbi:MAG: ribose-5-phosphate isomerase RpiA [Planctomycetota bacterium]|jgi:ribose 5-phosphate isomerase A|nr:ribose-5-phosphate isomerase RpiA [Planctomycetota bacterium]
MTADPYREGKRAAGHAAAALVEPGMKLGLGTGSTVHFLIERLGERVRDEGLDFTGVPTSQGTVDDARSQGLQITSLDEVDELDLTIDGADEIDPSKNMIKGGGGALLREKIVAAASREVAIVVSANKLVDHLGAFPLPVEILPFGWRQVAEKIGAMGGPPSRRERDGEPFFTDNGNFVLDCAFDIITAPKDLETAILQIPGVIECGLFIGMANSVFVGESDGTFRVID